MNEQSKPNFTIMFNSPVLLKFISLLLITTLFACSDHRIPGLSPSRLRLKTIIQQNGRQLVSEFQYNPQGQLSGIKTLKSDSTLRENSTYTYDSQNRLSQIQRIIQLKFPPDPTIIQTENYFFSYSGASQIAEIRYTNTTAVGLLFLCRPIYNATNQIVENQVDSFNGYESRQFTSQYTYTNTNLTAAHITFSPASYFDYSFTYDSQINPFYGIILPTGSVDIAPAPNDPVTVFIYPTKNEGIANLMSLSRNNVLSDGYNEYVYTYNSVGLPISRSARSPLPDHSVRGTIYFEYESY